MNDSYPIFDIRDELARLRTANADLVAACRAALDVWPRIDPEGDNADVYVRLGRAVDAAEQR